MTFSLSPLYKLFPNHYRQYRSRQGFKAERNGIAALKRTAPLGTIVVPAKTNRKDVDFWIIRKDRSGSLLVRPFQWKDVGSYGPIRKHFRKAPNVPVVVTDKCLKRISKAKK